MTRRASPCILAFLLVAAALAGDSAAEEPTLPEGLDPGGGESKPDGEDPGGPELPAGLGDGDGEPELPEGLGGGEAEDPGREGTGRQAGRAGGRLGAWLERNEIDLGGFFELRAGVRTQDDPYQGDDASVGEARLQIELEKTWGALTARATVDLVYDAVVDEHGTDLDEGTGVVDLRAAYVSFSPLEKVDVKLGRQVLTWGTGDLIFINDLFPKDWRSFFVGRDEEYLKAPSDALKAGLYLGAVNLDVVYSPRFDSDRFIDGSRISFWNSGLGRLSGDGALVEVERPQDWFTDDEAAARLSGTARGWELAAYAYRGFWKSPAGQDVSSGRATFPQLAAYGASIRGTVGGGIGNVEVGYYDSLDDPAGDDPLVRNGEFRAMVGYEREVARELTMGLQFRPREVPGGAPAGSERR